MRKFFNNSQQAITAAIAAAATSVTTAFAFAGMSTGDTAILTLSDPGETVWEIVGATKTVGGYDLTRGLESTTARDWPIGSTISTRVTAGLLAELTSLFGSANNGMVPASGGGSINFLRADGSWGIPSVTSTGALQFLTATNGGAFSSWNIDLTINNYTLCILSASNHSEINITVPTGTNTHRKLTLVFKNTYSGPSQGLPLLKINENSVSNMHVENMPYDPYASYGSFRIDLYIVTQSGTLYVDGEYFGAGSGIFETLPIS